MTANSIIQQKIKTVLNLINQLTQKERILLGFLALFLITALILFVFNISTSRDLATLKTKIKDFQSLSKQYEGLKTSVDTFEKKGTLSKGEGLLRASQRVFEELGLSKKLKSAKVTNTKELKTEYIEETVDIIAENLTINEILNVLYRIEKLPMMVAVKSLNIKRSFENPDNLHLQMSMSYFSKK